MARVTEAGIKTLGKIALSTKPAATLPALCEKLARRANIAASRVVEALHSKGLEPVELADGRWGVRPIRKRAVA